jgi:DNA-binding MarR family transcriptional regulator
LLFGQETVEATMADPVTGSISHLVFRVAREHRLVAGQLLREIGLHPGQELVMLTLWDNGPQRQADLVRMLGSDSATITRSVRRLERAGFVTCGPSPEDGRVVVVRPTEAGRALRAGVERVWRRLEELTTAGFSESDDGTTRAVLARLEDNLLAAAEGKGRP